MWRGIVENRLRIPRPFNADCLIFKVENRGDRNSQFSVIQSVFIQGIGYTEVGFQPIWADVLMLKFDPLYPFFIEVAPYRSANFTITVWEPVMPLVSSANNHSPIATATTSTTIPAVTTSIVLLPANANRLGATIYNDSNGRLYIDFDDSVTVTNYAIKINPGDGYELPYNYVGPISGVWSGTNGNAQIREFT